MDGRSVLSARAVAHSFDERLVLDDVSLALAAGEIVAVVGPSGCGKTTLLRACAGLLEPRTGRVDAGETTRGIVFQDPALLSWLRVSRNAGLFADSADREFVARLLSICGLAEHATKWPHQLSAGMKMRLSLVRALASRPGLLLLDEPFASLDQITRHRLHDEFAMLHEELGFAAILVTHSIDEAVYLADRVLVMSASPGRIVGEFDVPFTGRRVAALRYTADFARVCGTVAERLGEHA